MSVCLRKSSEMTESIEKALDSLRVRVKDL